MCLFFYYIFQLSFNYFFIEINYHNKKKFTLNQLITIHPYLNYKLKLLLCDYFVYRQSRLLTGLASHLRQRMVRHRRTAIALAILARHRRRVTKQQLALQGRKKKCTATAIMMLVRHTRKKRKTKKCRVAKQQSVLQAKKHSVSGGSICVFFRGAGKTHKRSKASLIYDFYWAETFQ